MDNATLAAYLIHLLSKTERSKEEELLYMTLVRALNRYYSLIEANLAQQQENGPSRAEAS